MTKKPRKDVPAQPQGRRRKLRVKKDTAAKIRRFNAAFGAKPGAKKKRPRASAHGPTVHGYYRTILVADCPGCEQWNEIDKHLDGPTAANCPKCGFACMVAPGSLAWVSATMAPVVSAR